MGIQRLHLEQDSGKSLHEENPNMSLVDLNRSGVALMEIARSALGEEPVLMAELRSLAALPRHLRWRLGKGNLRTDVRIGRKLDTDDAQARSPTLSRSLLAFVANYVASGAASQDAGEIRLFETNLPSSR